MDGFAVISGMCEYYVGCNDNLKALHNKKQKE